MSSNPWVAARVGETPQARERRLRRLWEEYLGDGVVDGARSPIVDSWRRSRDAGVDPARSRASTIVSARDEVAERWRAHPLEVAAPLIRRWLLPTAVQHGHLIVVSDADGMILWIEGDFRVRSSAADAMNFVEGSLWSESSAGTNAIGSAVAADHAIQVHGAEHYSAIVHQWTCSAAPVHDPEDGSVLGVIDLTGLATRIDDQTAAAVLAAARAVEADLRAHMQLRDTRLRLRHLDEVGKRREPIALVSASGRLIADDPSGLIRVPRISVPDGGGMVQLEDGRTVLAEPIEGEDAFLVRQPPESLGRAVPLRKREVSEWRRSQLQLSRIADEQAALRRVATLVAGQATADEIFAVVAEEIARLLDVQIAGVICYPPDGAMEIAKTWTASGAAVAPGTRIELADDSVAAAVRASGRPMRRDDYSGISNAVVDLAAELEAFPRSAVGAPIVVNGRLWGAVLASSTRALLPEDAEARLLDFAELAATAISNAVARNELEESRARIATAADDARQRIERDLHDRLQQRLVSLAVRIGAAERALPGEERAELATAASEIAAAISELREISHGIHPVVLTRRGLGPALRRLVRRSVIPVVVEIQTHERFQPQIEAAAYYGASEALTNVAKHAAASQVRILLEEIEGWLSLSIEDDGVGGADPNGSGLVGMRDRVAAVGGTVTVVSAAGSGTSVRISIPARREAAD